MKRAVFVFLVCSLLSRGDAESDVAVAQSAEWREASPTDRAKVEQTARHSTLVDCSFYGRSGTAFLQKFAITESDPIEAFRVFRSGTIAGLNKHGLSIASEKEAVGAAIPGRLVLMEGAFGKTKASALVWTVYTADSAYLLTFVGTDRLDIDSAMVRSYLSRLQFTKLNELSSVPPISRLDAAWLAGNRTGEIFFGILFFGLPILAVFIFRRLRGKNERPNQTQSQPARGSS